MRRVLRWLCSSALIVAAQCSPPGSEALRVGQVNIAGWAIYGGQPDAAADLAAAIAARDLDVVGIAEVCESQVVAATEALDSPYEYVFQQTVAPDALPWSPPPESGCRYGNALIARSDVELEQVASIELPTEDFTTEHEWDPEEDRWILCGRINRQVEIVVCTTHLTNLEPLPDSRLRQVTAIRDSIEGLRSGEDPVVLVGDFNARIGDADLAPVESWRNASRNSGVIHVLVQGLAPLRRGNLGVGRTDHQLVWASLHLPGS